MANDWQDAMVGARMAVDREFGDTVQSSSLSRQQWGLVMTAVEFEMENADDPETARLVADTSKLEHVLSEMQSVDDQMSRFGAGGGGGGSRGGVVDGIKSALGLGDDGDDTEELAATAERLADEYVTELQAHLEDDGRWTDVRRAAAAGE